MNGLLSRTWPWPLGSCAGALINEWFNPNVGGRAIIYVVNIFVVWVPVRSHVAVVQWIARDHTWVYNTTCEATAKESPFKRRCNFIISNIVIK